MSFAISGFGAQQYQASPQIFQALSLGGATPAPPQQPFGTPNQSLVPLAQNTAGPALNLSLQAAPIAAAIEALTQSGTPQLAPSVSSPALPPATSLTTAFTGAHNTNVLISSGPPDALDGLYGGLPPQGVVAFTVRAPILNPAALLPSPAPVQRTAQAPVQPSSHTVQAPAPANPASVAKIVATVKNLAVSAVYPQSIFTFAA